MKDVGGVHEEQSAQDLVDEVLYVFVTELLTRVDDPVEVGLHQVGDDVNVGIASPCLRLENID